MTVFAFLPYLFPKLAGSEAPAADKLFGHVAGGAKAALCAYLGNRFVCVCKKVQGAVDAVADKVVGGRVAREFFKDAVASGLAHKACVRDFLQRNFLRKIFFYKANHVF